MRSFDSLSNDIGGLPAQTVQAGTHTPFSFVPTLGDSETAGVPTKFLFCDPTLLAARGGDPHRGSPSSVNNRQGPFGFKLQDFSVANALTSKRVNNFNRFDTQNHLGFNPKSVNNHTEGRTKSQFDNRLHCVGTYQDAVCTKKNYQHVRTASPRKIASGAKSFIHNPSIAGETK